MFANSTSDPMIDQLGKTQENISFDSFGVFFECLSQKIYDFSFINFPKKNLK